MGDERLIIFGSDRGLSRLAQSKAWHADGTFETCPKFFEQVYVIHARIKDKTFPCVYALMTNMTTETYKKLLSSVKDAASGIGLTLQPESIMSDFEKAAQAAFKFHFPRIKLRGCSFHYAQCLWKHLGQCGMQSAYNQDTSLKSWFKRVVALHLVPGLCFKRI